MFELDFWYRQYQKQRAYIAKHLYIKESAQNSDRWVEIFRSALAQADYFRSKIEELQK